MINKIKLFFEQQISFTDSSQATEENIHLACAALFIEMMYMDDKLCVEETEMILNRISDMFGLSIEDANALISLATMERKKSTDYYQFTSLINKGFTQAQKIQVIKALWQLAYADGELDMHEEHMVRKMADLLHVPHMEFIRTKNQVKGG